MWYTYILLCSDNSLYTGYSDNPKQRLLEHNTKRGAKFTKYIPDFKIVFLEQYDSLTQARKREIQIKNWRRDKKEVLIDRYSKNLPTKS